MAVSHSSITHSWLIPTKTWVPQFKLTNDFGQFNLTNIGLFGKLFNREKAPKVDMFSVELLYKVRFYRVLNVNGIRQRHSTEFLSDWGYVIQVRAFPICRQMIFNCLMCPSFSVHASWSACYNTSIGVHKALDGSISSQTLIEHKG